MSRSCYVYRPDHPMANHNGMVDRNFVGYEPMASATMVIPDCMDDTRHMADGKYYNSKSKFRRVTRDHGCIEVGNEIPTLTAPRQIVELDRRERREAIARAYYEVKNGRRFRYED